MVDTASYIEFLERRGVNFSIVGGQLRMVARPNALCDSERRELQARREEVAAFVGECNRVNALHVADCEPGGSRVPLSWGQRQLYRLMITDASPITYHMSDVLKMNGPIELDRLVESLKHAVRAHDAFFIRLEEGVPEASNPEGIWQFMDRSLLVDIKMIDLRGEIPSIKQHRLEELTRQMRDEPFDLLAGPLFRFCVLRTDEEELYCLMTVHHLISDDWSMGIFHKAIAVAYADPYSAAGGALSRQPRSVSYFQFVLWYQMWVDSPACELHLAYWKRQLRGLPALLPVPTDRPRRPVAVNRTASLVSRLTSATGAGMRQLAVAQESSYFMILMAAFQVLVWRLTLQARIPVATLMANRDQEGCDEVVGLFFNAVVIVGEVSHRKTFTELLSEIKHTIFEAYKRQRVPMQRVVDELCTEKDPSYAPLAQTMLVFQNVPQQAFRVNSVSLTKLGGINVGSAYDVKISAFESGGLFEIVWEYNAELFDEATLVSWSQAYLSLLGEIVARPGSAIADLRLGETTSEAPRVEKKPVNGLTVVDMLRSAAETGPERVAVRDGNHAVTYRELEQRISDLSNLIGAPCRK